MRYLLACLVIFACVCCAPEPPKTADEVAANFRATLDAVVALTADGRAYCSGVWHRDRILTAAHCVEGENEARYSVFDDYSYDHNRYTRSFSAYVVRSDEVLDVALLEPEGADADGRYRNLLLADDPPYMGQRVFAVGHPYGLGFYVSEGRVVAPLRHGALDEDMPWISTNVHLYPGMSGGPLLTEDAEILGINSFGRAPRGVNGISGHVPVSAVRSFLAED